MLSTDMRRTGEWLFRHRSFLPMVLLPALILETCRNAERLSDVGGLDFAWGFICAGVAFVGVIVRALVTGYAPPGTSGRNTRKQIAESLTTTGLYSLTRNPLYFGNLIIVLGVISAARSWELSTITFLLFLLYYERIIAAEEAFLSEKFGDAYAEWAASTPWLFPRPRGWRRPETRFSLRKVIRGEYYAAFGIVSGVFVVEHARRAWQAWPVPLDRAWDVVDPVWGIVWCSAAFLFALLRTLKKRTRLLKVS